MNFSETTSPESPIFQPRALAALRFSRAELRAAAETLRGPAGVWWPRCALEELAADLVIDLRGPDFINENEWASPIWLPPIFDPFDRYAFTIGLGWWRSLWGGDGGFGIDLEEDSPAPPMLLMGFRVISQPAAAFGE